jgi:hypothetical protein
MAALEEGRNLLLLAVGARGIAAARAALNWAPVQAHATRHKVRWVGAGAVLGAPRARLLLLLQLFAHC